MRFGQQKVVRAVAPLLVFSISQLYIQASLTSPNTPAQDPQTAAATGRLEIYGKKHILVDDHDTEAGATIVNAQTLETSDCSSATVHVLSAANEVGTVELGASSKAVINFSPGNVKVTLVSGCARVKTSPGTDATISAPDGTALPADACYPSTSKRDFAPSCVPPGVTGSGASPGGVSPGVAIAVTAAAATGIGLTYLNICNRAADTSPITPNAGQCR